MIYYRADFVPQWFYLAESETLVWMYQRRCRGVREDTQEKGGKGSEPAERRAEDEEEEVVVDSDATVNDSASKNKATAVVL